jgi:hypothetical protein
MERIIVNYLIKCGVPSKMQEMLSQSCCQSINKVWTSYLPDIVGTGVDIMASRELGHKRICLERDENLK